MKTAAVAWEAPAKRSVLAPKKKKRMRSHTLIVPFFLALEIFGGTIRSTRRDDDDSKMSKLFDVAYGTSCRRG